MTDPVEDAIRQFHATNAHRDQLQAEVDRLNRALELQRHQCDRLQVQNTTLSAERDHYMVQCATLKNDLVTIQNIIGDSIKKARDTGFGRERLDPTLLPPDDAEILSRLSYSGNRRLRDN